MCIRDSSREVQSKDAFFAIKGERFDGHDFVEQAAAQGCRTFIVSDQEKVEKIKQKQSEERLHFILVKDTVKALQTLAKYYISTLPLKKKIAVTGSVGKTTTKEFCYAGLAAFGPAIKTAGNQNNEIGVPNTLFLSLIHI